MHLDQHDPSVARMLTLLRLRACEWWRYMRKFGTRLRF